MLKRKFKREWK